MLFEQSSVERKLDGAIFQTREQKRICQFQGISSFPGRRNQRCSVQDGSHKIRQNSIVLSAVSFNRYSNIPSRRRGEAAGIGSRKFTHRHFVPAKQELVIFDYDFTSFGSHFETVSAWRFAGRSVDD